MRHANSLMPGRWRSLASLIVGLAVVASTVPLSASKAASASSPGRNRSDSTKQIIHLLDRIGFGPRPGDVERVRSIGTARYIDLQLHPERIDDAAVQARLSGISSLHMSVEEAYEKYPEPGMIARQIGLVAKNGKAGQGGIQNGLATADQPNAAGQTGDQSTAQAASDEQKQRRQALQAYYAEHGLKPPMALLMDLQTQKLIRAVYSDRQLEEAMTDFWFNHFNIYWPKGADRWLTADFEMHVIRPHVLGKFKDLLMATAKSPAMLFYLDNYLSSSPDAVRPVARRIAYRRMGPFSPPVPVLVGPLPRPQNPNAARKPGINENYARELMELHTLGVDGGYTQKDVQEVARCFTGWSIDAPRRGAHFVYRDWMHDNGDKVVLGRVIRNHGEKDGEEVIDLLARNPNTARFISAALARRFVSDAPPKSIVDRLSAVYLKSDGDIREMMRALLTSPEFNSPAAYRAKIKSPFELVASAIRAVGGDTDGSPALGQWLARMGEPLYRYQAPTGYPDRAEQWVNTGTLLERLNFALALTGNKIPGTTANLGNATGAGEQQLVDRAVTEVLGGDISTETRSVLDKQMAQPIPAGAIRSAAAIDGTDDMQSLRVQGTQPKPGLDERLARRAEKMSAADAKATAPPIDPVLAKAFGLVLGSPEFQRR